MKITKFSEWLNESQEEYSKKAAARNFLHKHGMATDVLAELEEIFRRERFSVERVEGTDGHVTLFVKTTRWEEDTWHHDSRRRGKARPNTYEFLITEWGAEPGTVRINWFSLKHHGGEIVMEDNPAAIVSKVKSLIYQ